MFETIFSSADKLIEAGEEIQETRYRSRLDPTYLKRFMGAGGIAIVLSIIIVLGGTTGMLPDSIPTDYITALLIVPVLVILWIEIEHHSLMYHFTDKRMIEERGVFSKSFSSVPYKDITRVRISQDPSERILGTGNLKIEVKGTDQEEVVVNGVRHPQQFRMKLTAQKKAHKKRQEGEEPVQQPEPQPSAGGAFTKERLEAELGRVERRRNRLERQYEDGQLSQEEYERRWYMLQGEEEAIERQLDQLDAA